MPPDLSESSEVDEHSFWCLSVQGILDNTKQQLVQIFNALEGALLDKLSKSQQECTALTKENCRLRQLLEQMSPAPAKCLSLEESLQNPTINASSQKSNLHESFKPEPFKTIRPTIPEFAAQNPCLDTTNISAISFPCAVQQEDVFAWCNSVPPRADSDDTQAEDCEARPVAATPSFEFLAPGSTFYCPNEDNIQNHDEAILRKVTTQFRLDQGHVPQGDTETCVQSCASQACPAFGDHKMLI